MNEKSGLPDDAMLRGWLAKLHLWSQEINSQFEYFAATEAFFDEEEVERIDRMQAKISKASNAIAALLWDEE